jgi:hypothetical protein
MGITMNAGERVGGEFSMVCFKALPRLRGGAEEILDYLERGTSYLLYLFTS